MESQIHSTAIVDPSARLGEGVSVGPYAVIESGTEIGEGCLVESHAVIKQSAVLEENVRVGHFSVVGGDPQHLSFEQSLSSSVRIGEGTRLGEGVTVHRSMYEDGVTMVGRNCFLMGYSHVAHDCRLGDDVILANGALLGGHVSVGGHVFVGGGAGLHQFSRVGEGSMIGGLTEVSADVPPQVTVSGRNRACGLNLIGLKRRKVARETIKELKDLYRSILMKGGNPSQHAKKIIEGSSPPESSLGLSFAEFFLHGERGFVRSRSSRDD